MVQGEHRIIEGLEETSGVDERRTADSYSAPNPEFVPVAD